MDADPRLQRSISHTSRQKRTEEVDGCHYHFLSVDEFVQMRDSNAFAEYAEVFGNYYGTSFTTLEASLKQGIDTLLVIDWQGARNVRRRFAHTTGIYLLPPTLSVLRERLVTRDGQSPAQVDDRMSFASSEMSHCTEYDFVLINDTLDSTVEDIQAIIESVRVGSHLKIGPDTAHIERILASG